MLTPLFVLFVGLIAQTNSVQKVDNLVDIDVWLNKEEPVYTPGEKMKVFFKVDRNCYVAVYDIDVGGRENLLFPQPGDNGYVRADEIYELPTPDADYDYEITGPEGTEKIVVLASTSGLPDLDETDEVSKREIEISIEDPEPAKLRIISAPPKCRIYIKDVLSGKRVYVGKAPRTIVLRPGEYIVEIKRLGYQTIKRRIFLEPDERRRVYVRLLPW